MGFQRKPFSSPKVLSFSSPKKVSREDLVKNVPLVLEGAQASFS
jgi:hypothetical protein